MASSLVGVRIVGNAVTIFNVGDSRAYLLTSGVNGGPVHILSRDHSLLNDMLTESCQHKLLEVSSNNHPPAKPGVFNIVSRSKRQYGVAYAAPTLCATCSVAAISTAPAVRVARLDLPWIQSTLAPRSFAL